MQKNVILVVLILAFSNNFHKICALETMTVQQLGLTKVLLKAIFARDEKRIRNALENGADFALNIPNIFGNNTAFEQLVHWNIRSIDLIDYAIKKGAKITPYILSMAAQTNTGDVLLRRLLAEQPDVMQKAASNGLTVFEYLLGVPTAFKPERMSLLVAQIKDPKYLKALTQIKQKYDKKIATDKSLNQSALEDWKKDAELIQQKINDLESIITGTPEEGMRFSRTTPTPGLIASYIEEGEESPEEAMADAEERWKYWNKKLSDQISSLKKLRDRIPTQQKNLADRNTASALIVELIALNDVPKPKKATDMQTADAIRETVQNNLSKLHVITNKADKLGSKYPVKG